MCKCIREVIAGSPGTDVAVGKTSKLSGVLKIVVPGIGVGPKPASYGLAFVRGQCPGYSECFCGRDLGSRGRSARLSSRETGAWRRCPRSASEELGSVVDETSLNRAGPQGEQVSGPVCRLHSGPNAIERLLDVESCSCGYQASGTERDQLPAQANSDVGFGIVAERQVEKRLIEIECVLIDAGTGTAIATRDEATIELYEGAEVLAQMEIGAE